MIVKIYCDQLERDIWINTNSISVIMPNMGHYDVILSNDYSPCFHKIITTNRDGLNRIFKACGYMEETK